MTEDTNEKTESKGPKMIRKRVHRKGRKKRPVYVAESNWGGFSITHFVSILLIGLVLIYLLVQFISD